MRVFALLFVVLSLVAGGAVARDDIMPPPKPAPRIPVEQQALDGSVSATTRELREAEMRQQREAEREAARQQKAREVAAAREASIVPAPPLRSAMKTAEAAPAIQQPAPQPVQQQPSPTANLATAQELEGKGSALDGERIVVGGKEIRLFGIVTPALTSSYGPQTRLNLDRMLSNSNVLCKVTNRDAEGNPVAFCGTVKVPDLSYEMLRQGWAMVDRRTLKGNSLSDVYEKAELEAQNQNRGIFAPAPMAMTVPVSDPTRSVTVPVPESAKAEAQPEAAPIPDISTALQKFAAPREEAPVQQAAPGTSFVERYQILLGAFVLLCAAGVFGFFLMWRERKILADKRKALAAALRGELMSARLICRTRARELLRARKTDIEPRHPTQLWPRVRSVVYQAHVAQLGLLGADLARQVASVYGQCADYAAYYHSNSVRTPIPQVVGETLNTLSEHMDTLLLGLQEVESTGNALIGDDSAGEEETRVVAENVRLALAAAHKRLPPPMVTAETIKAKRSARTITAASAAEALEDDAEEPEGADDLEDETAEQKSPRPTKVA